MSIPEKKPNLPNDLNIPSPYWLQEYTDNSDFLRNFQDKHGYGFMHWAVATSNIDKVKELCHCKFSYTLKSKNNQLPTEIINKYFSSCLFESQNMGFTLGGMTPAHLNVYLHYMFYKLSKNVDIKGQFTFEKQAEKQKNIFMFFYSLDSNIFKLHDLDGFTVTDYCFLLENFDLLHSIAQIDTSLSSLHKIKTKTALEIITIAQKVSNKEKFQPIVFEKLNTILNTKLNYEHMDAFLPVKNVIISEKVNKI